MDNFSKIASLIIRAQENIIGPLAIEQAKKVGGLELDWAKHQVLLKGDEKKVLDELVKQYEHIFGLASIQVCKDAVKGLVSELSKDQIPPSLAN